jgi:hypothetical protein
LAERLQGNWSYQRTFPDQGYTRREYATMEVNRTSIKYNYGIFWDCDPPGPCPGAPDPKSDFFEGIFRDLGDSLALQDGKESLGFRDITDDSFTFIVSGLSFPMRRTGAARAGAAPPQGFPIGNPLFDDPARPVSYR